MLGFLWLPLGLLFKDDTLGVPPRKCLFSALRDEIALDFRRQAEDESQHLGTDVGAEPTASVLKSSYALPCASPKLPNSRIPEL
jgi:hypothetical protein